MAGERIITTDGSLGQKYAIVSSEIKEHQPEIGINVVLPFGVTVITNSDALGRDISQIIDQIAQKDIATDSQTLFYFVKENLTGNEGLTPEIVDGNIVVSSDLSTALVVGQNKIGSVFSAAYGLKSLRSVREGRLGLHSALVLDMADNKAIVVCGSNGTGKSTLAYSLRYAAPDRFRVVTDEWNEVDVSGKLAHPISFAVGQPKDSKVAQLVDCDSQLIKACTSYGKNWYLPNDKLGRSSCDVKQVIFLSTHTMVNDPEYMFRRINLNVPFINTIQGSILDENVVNAINLYVEAGIDLIQNPLARVIDITDRSVSETVDLIQEII